MAVQLNITEAKAKLSELVKRAELGEEVVIARRGKPRWKPQWTARSSRELTLVSTAVQGSSLRRP